MKKLLLLLSMIPVSSLFGQTVYVDDLTPGEFATYTFTYITANNLGGNSAGENVTLFSTYSQPAFSAIEPVANSIDSLAAHMSVKINGIDEPVTASNFSDWLSGITANGVQISLHGTGNQVAAGSEIEISFSGVFQNSPTAVTDTIKWATNLGTGATLESFQSVSTLGSLSLNQNSSTDLSLNLYPNPVQTSLNISGFKGKQEYVIYNSIGGEVLHGEILENTPISIEQLNDGMYFIKTNNSKAIKFTKQD